MIEELDAELDRAGIDALRRRRIVAEFRDHLSCDPDAALGDPRQLATEFADELGTHRARSSAVLAFIVLAIAAALYAIVVAPVLAGSGFLSTFVPYGSPGPATAVSELVIGVALVLAPQVAFVAGVLALLRVLRHRDRTRVSAAETRLILWRSAVAVTAGLVTMAALFAAVVLSMLSGPGPADSMGAASVTVAVAAGVTAFMLAAILIRVVRAFRIRGSAPGVAEWLGDDLAALLPAAASLRPWQIAAATATAVGVAVFLAGVVALDGIDGALRGVAEAGACVLGYIVLGKVLGLRPTAVDRTAATDSEPG